MLSTWLTGGNADRAARASFKQQDMSSSCMLRLRRRTHVGAEGDAYELVLAGEDSRVLELHVRQAHGLERVDGILDACKKRFRSIVMTTIAMGAGDLSFWAPMAFVVIGGLLTSTLLSLLVIPVFYSGVDDAVNWLRRLTPNRRKTITAGVD